MKRRKQVLVNLTSTRKSDKRLTMSKGSQMAERLGNRAYNQKVAGSILVY